MTITTPIAINKAIEEVLRCDRGRLVAGLVSRLGDFQVAEDALQEACISAMSHWGLNGLPNSPVGWLMKVALNKGIDRARAIQRDRKKNDQLMILTATHFETIDEEPIPDERLRLIFTCCHPLLEEKSRIGLTLRTICHLTTREISEAFLDKEKTMGQRISRAKEKLRDADIDFEIPDQSSWPARLDSVLSTIYLIFTTGYVNEDDSDRDLCAEAIYLLRLLDRLRPDDPEIEGALALVLLTDARRIARIGTDGATVPPAEQDRSQWDMHKVEEARSILSQAVLRGRPGPYQIKAAIADCHMMGNVPDWKQISLLYGSLWMHEPTPIVALNWAIVVAEVGQPELALSKIKALENDLKTFQPYYAAYAGIQSQLGEIAEAKRAYQMAIQLSQNSANKMFLEKKLEKLS
ncbi:MAG: RNA polymerase sigma factor [Granulosicoccus sp.]